MRERKRVRGREGGGEGELAGGAGGKGDTETHTHVSPIVRENDGKLSAHTRTRVGYTYTYIHITASTPCAACVCVCTYTTIHLHTLPPVSTTEKTQTTPLSLLLSKTRPYAKRQMPGLDWLKSPTFVLQHWMNKLALCAGKLGARSKWHHDTTHLLKNERRSQYG